MPVTPQRVHKIFPPRGRKTSLPADIIGDDYSPDNLNVRFRFGEVRPTPGRDLLTGPTTGGSPLWIGQFPQLDGTVWAVMLTTTKAYRWGDGSPGNPRQWHEILPGDAVPIGTSRWTVAIGEGRMFFGRIEDPIFSWDGNAGHPFTSVQADARAAGFTGIGGSSPANVPKAQFLEYFNDRLIAAFTLESGSTIGNRVRWAQSGEYRKWDETPSLGAGFLDLVEGGQEPIRGIRSFGSGDRMFATSRTTIKDFVTTGTLDPTFVEQLRVRGSGCNAPYTIGTTGQQVFFMCYDCGVYAWNGVQMNFIGEPIYEELFNLIKPSQMNNYFAVVSTHRQEYWLVLDTGDAFIYDYLRQAWSRDTVPGFTTMGEVEDTTFSPAWTDMTTLWQTEPHTWNGLLGTNLTTLFGGRPDGSTARIDDAVQYDYFSIGSILDRFVETPDFYIDMTQAGMRESTVLRLLLLYQFVNANPFAAGVSFDRGISWHEQQVTPTSQGYSYVEFGGPFTGNVVRFRFRENDATGSFRWRSYSWEWIDAGDYIGTVTG